MSERQPDPDSALSKTWLAPSYLIVLLLALFLTAHNANYSLDINRILFPFYWILRLSAGFFLFVGTMLVLESTPINKWRGWPVSAFVACIVSLLPFVMIITMLDLVLGQPELGGLLASTPDQSLIKLFLIETIYLSDNHFVFCLLVIFPRVILESAARFQPADPAQDEQTDSEVTSSQPRFLSYAKPALGGEILSVEAQEHYIKIYTTQGSSLALYRFRDALRELEAAGGLQIHRSYWISDTAVSRLEKSSRGLRVILVNGEEFPVSRRFEMAVRSRYASDLAKVT